MKKEDLVKQVSKKTGISQRKVLGVINSFIEALREGIEKDGKVVLVGFGTFEVRTRKARKGRNPRTGKPINIPAKKYVKFKPGKALKAKVER